VNYDGSHYRRLLADYPDSNIADEAAYRLVLLHTDPDGRPENIRQELGYFEEVLERYPTSSFRHEIFYEMAYRCHRLYERYTYSGQSDLQQARLYREKAVYLYSLALKSPQHGLFAEKAWKNLQDLEDGRRLFP
jgi:outer membrane protein assembly factor BamD (BamD/ComL family)